MKSLAEKRLKLSQPKITRSGMSQQILMPF